MIQWVLLNQFMEACPTLDVLNGLWWGSIEYVLVVSYLPVRARCG